MIRSSSLGSKPLIRPTANQARSACGKHADRLLFWMRSPDDLWIAEEDEVYQVEADPPEG